MTGKFRKRKQTIRKRKKRLTLEEYINNPTADVDEVLSKKQKISPTEWNIVHYFYTKLDNVNYTKHDQEFEDLKFSTSEDTDNLIKGVLREYKTIPLNESQEKYFEEKKDAYEEEQRGDATTKKAEEDYDTGYLNIDKK